MSVKRALVIVESPTKARTIGGFLGESFKVISSMGHCVDLPSSKLGIDVENDFFPHYKVIKGKEKIIRTIKKEVKNSDPIYLATDPDREGEAISWHIRNILSVKNETKKFFRVVFHEITKEAILSSFQNPSDIDQNMVNAQQTRRILDRIVGYFLSPFLWKKIVRGLSAGRVQSVALKFIVDREKKVSEFIPKTFYHIDAFFEKDGVRFKARLTKNSGKPIIIDSLDEAERIRKILQTTCFKVDGIKENTSHRKPQPPFITSSLQQEAFRRFHFSSAKTMLLAQRLYEGIELGEGLVGLITYMRTDSFSISPKAEQEVQQYIEELYGTKYLPEKPHFFKGKTYAQHAHEAIRPTGLSRTPSSIANFLDADASRLYEIIWNRFLASRMKEAEVLTTQVRWSAAEYEFLTVGMKLIFDGFLKTYGEPVTEELLPALQVGLELTPVEITIDEGKTKPPARFNDASLVRLLEEKGIGRPSTYAPTISTLLARNYMRRINNAFVPTELGILVIKLLDEYFKKIIDENFTAEMEKNLDLVEDAKVSGNEILHRFYPEFLKEIEHATATAQKVVEYADSTCELCGKPMVIKWSRRGKFLSCSGYPQCKHAKPLTTRVKCPQCDGELIERRNKRGQRFFGCSKFPQCRFTSSHLPEQETVPTDQGATHTPSGNTPEENRQGIT